MKKLVTALDRFLDMTTMYRVVLYGLSALLLYALLLSGLKVIAFSLSSLILSFVVLVGVSLLTHVVCARLFKAPAFVESSFITAFILFFIVAPPQSTSEVVWVVVAAFVAILSKYIVAYKHKHIFNPVAIALVVISACGSYASIWWMGSTAMIVPTLIVGLLVIKKLRRFPLFFTYVGVSTLVVLLYAVVHGAPLYDALLQHFISWPTIFFGAIMLSEPSTMPPTRKLQIGYAGLIGIISSIPFHLGTFLYSSPELALIIGNIVAFLMSTKGRIALTFKERITVAQDTYEYVFKKDQTFSQEAGQYMEWTLPHAHPDTRGIRRYFTIASSPDDEMVRLGVKIVEGGSSFKKALQGFSHGYTMYATSVAGDFVLPQDTTKKLVFLAGGIGITPFISMVRELSSKGGSRDIVLLYAARNEAALGYKAYLEEVAKKVGMKVIYILNEGDSKTVSSEYRIGVLQEAMLKELLPDYKTRTYYLSGPQVMVQAFTTTLKTMGIKGGDIHTDYFPGFA